MPEARRCPACKTDWPTLNGKTPDFQVCPECEKSTQVVLDGDPISLREAVSRRKHADFDRWYDAEWIGKGRYLVA